METMQEVADYVSPPSPRSAEAKASAGGAATAKASKKSGGDARTADSGDDDDNGESGAARQRAASSQPMDVCDSKEEAESAGAGRVPPAASAKRTDASSIASSYNATAGKAASSGSSSSASSQADQTERFKYVPLRLTVEERTMLKVLEKALEVSEYTDVVDVTFSHTHKSKVSRIVESLVELLSIVSGLLMSSNFAKGELAVARRSLNDNVPLFSELFEIGRRYKIMNPTKMRGTYGKLMYMIMDTESYVIKSDLKVSFLKPIQTVHTLLEARDALHILGDPLLLAATASISNEGGDKNKRELAAEAARKGAAAEALVAKYASSTLKAEEIVRVLESIADNEAYREFNVRPVERILAVLRESFNPAKPEEPFSLALKGGKARNFVKNITNRFYSGYSSSYMGGGAELSHDHATQFTFVLQSFSLWREIMLHMPKLWMMADLDMLCESYRLVDTGQGYQRLQSAPRIRGMMNRILSHVQNKCGSWVGLSVVHLGDRDVPNALVFIDKYSQVPRILAPIARCIDQLPALAEDAAFHNYVSQEWGSITGLRLQILSDFFKHGFDGSGDDGGSCIDGRLTSAWNWCSRLHKKPYYHVFMFTGFQGFDGDWKEN